mmetsp:Transcript_28273/g.72701  ORF Transcript_28273/g.72701 Transcript_28273/m.72701 type:complete len:369 (+) Transcript_28273:1229-2335(+)
MHRLMHVTHPAVAACVHVVHVMHALELCALDEDGRVGEDAVDDGLGVVNGGDFEGEVLVRVLQLRDGAHELLQLLHVLQKLADLRLAQKLLQLAPLGQEGGVVDGRQLGQQLGLEAVIGAERHPRGVQVRKYRRTALLPFAKHRHDKALGQDVDDEPLCVERAGLGLQDGVQVALHVGAHLVEVPHELVRHGHHVRVVLPPGPHFLRLDKHDRHVVVQQVLLEEFRDRLVRKVEAVRHPWCAVRVCALLMAQADSQVCPQLVQAVDLGPVVQVGEHQEEGHHPLLPVHHLRWSGLLAFVRLMRKGEGPEKLLAAALRGHLEVLQQSLYLSHWPGEGAGVVRDRKDGGRPKDVAHRSLRYVVVSATCAR